MTLTTKRNPRKVKGFDSIFGAIIDGDNNLVCLAPVTHIDWIYDCLTAKTKTEKLLKMLSQVEDESVQGRVCTKEDCRDEIKVAIDEEKVSNNIVAGSAKADAAHYVDKGIVVAAHAERGCGVVIVRKPTRKGSAEAA